MSDVADGSGQVPRRSVRASEGGGPAGGALAVVLALVAVIAGFFLLRSISDDSGDLGITSAGASDGSDSAPSSTEPAGTASTTPTIAPTPTTPQIIVTGAKVMVVNANGVGGSAGAMSRALEAAYQFEMSDPGDASGEVVKDGPLAASIIYYDSGQVGAKAVADTLNFVLGNDLQVAVLPPGTAPTKSGSIGDAGVVLMLGTDKQGKTLADLNPTASGASTGAPVVATNPSIVPSSTTG